MVYLVLQELEESLTKDLASAHSECHQEGQDVTHNQTRTVGSAPGHLGWGKHQLGATSSQPTSQPLQLSSRNLFPRDFGSLETSARRSKSCFATWHCIPKPNHLNPCREALGKALAGCAALTSAHLHFCAIKAEISLVYHKKQQGLKMPFALFSSPVGLELGSGFAICFFPEKRTGAKEKPQ